MGYELWYYSTGLDFKICLRAQKVSGHFKNGPQTLQGRIQDFFRRGCTRRLLYFNANKPHSFFFFFLQNTSCIRKPQVISGRGAHPLHPPPRSAPDKHTQNRCEYYEKMK